MWFAPGRASVFALLLSLAEPAAAPDADFVAWARSRAAPIDASGKAFRSLDRDLENVRLIGVGESVHQVQEFLTFRLELLQDLVRRQRVTALVLESGLPEAMAADDYVRGRTAAIDFDVALPGGYAAPTEIRRAVEWIREWNLGDGRSRPVGVYGADLPNRSGSMIPALDRLAELTEENRDVQGAIEAVRPTASRIAGDWWKAAIDKYDALSPEAKTALAAGVARLVERVEAVSDADRERLAWARRVAIVVRQHEEMLRLGPFSPARDRAMADNTLWVVGRIGSGERAVYWAHNAHVQRVRVNGPSLPAKDLVPAGAHFQEALGDRYYAIGTAYGGTAVDKSAMPNEEESVDRVLETVAKGPFLLTWRGAGAPRRAEAWLARVRPMRFQVQYLEVALGPAFDAVAYFGRATPAARAKKNPS